MVSALNRYLTKEYRNHYGFIYITTNLTNGKQYIGQKRIDDGSRWMSYLGSGSMILKAISKYGRDNFKRDILEICDSAEELDKSEHYWIEKFNAVESEKFYNLIEGGKVSTIISNLAKSPCICINNNRVFESLKDASVWCNKSVTYIKNSFGKMYYEGLPNDGYIFRDLKHVKYKHRLCSICGDSFIPKNNVNKYCQHCAEVDIDKLKISLPKINESITTYSLNDLWVEQFIASNYDGRRNYNKRNNILKKLNTKPKDKVKSKKYIVKNVDKINIRNELPDDVLLMKSDIIESYTINKENINAIAKKYDLKNDHIKRVLIENDISIRPNAYNSYSNNPKEEYVAVIKDNKIIHIFKYSFEFRYWCEKVKNISISRNRIKHILDNNIEVKGFTIIRVDKSYFDKNNTYYKTIDLIKFN